jgi:hypothetical protein
LHGWYVLTKKKSVRANRDSSLPVIIREWSLAVIEKSAEGSTGGSAGHHRVVGEKGRISPHSFSRASRITRPRTYHSVLGVPGSRDFGLLVVDFPSASSSCWRWRKKVRGETTDTGSRVAPQSDGRLKEPVALLRGDDDAFG